MFRTLILVALSLVACTHDTQRSDPTTASSRHPSQTEPWQVCLERLCGDQIGGYTARWVNVIERITASRGIVPKIRESSEQAFDAHIAEALEYARTIERELAAGTKLSTSDEKIIAQIMRFIGEFKHLVLNSEGKVDEHETRNAMAAAATQLDKESWPMFFLVAQILVDAQVSPPKLFQEPSGYLTELYSEAELRQLINQTIDTIVTGQKDIANRFQIDPETIFDTTRAQAQRFNRLRSGEITDHDLDQLKEDYDSVIPLKTLFDHPQVKALLPKGPVPLTEVLGSNIPGLIQEKVKVFRQHLENPSASDSPFSQKRNELTKTCVQTAAGGEEFLPTAQQIAAFRKQESGLRGEYLTKLSAKLPARASATVTTHGRSWVFRAPKTAEEFRRVLEHEIRDAAADARNWAERAQSPDPRLRRVLLVSALFGVSDLQDDDYDSVTKEICTEHSVNPVSDSAFFGNRLFTAGSLTITDPEMARDNLFHEYTHLVSGQVQKNEVLKASIGGWYNSSRACLGSLHDKNGDSFHEEDWADMLDAAFNIRVPKFYCYMLTSSASEVTRVKEQGPHSAIMHRLFTAMASRDLPMPPACAAALAAKGEHTRHHSCLKP